MNSTAIAAGGKTLLELRFTTYNGAHFNQNATAQVFSLWKYVTTYTSENRIAMICDGQENYRFGFNGHEKDNEVKGSGNSLDFGARIYDSRLGKWLSLDSSRSKFPAWSPYHFGYNNPIVTIDPGGKENIVLVGGQYDNSAGNKMMFVHQALRQLQQYRSNEKDETRSLVLFTEGYTSKQIKHIELAATKLGASVIRVNSSEEVTNYVNSKAADASNLTANRTGDLVTNLDIFAHGLVGSIELGYKQKNADAARFDANDASQLDPGAFSSDAILASYACRTGLGNSDINIFAWPGEDVKKNKSLAQVISNSANISVKAYMRRTDYSNTLGNRTDRLSLKMFDQGIKTDRGSNFNKEIGNRVNLDGAAFDPDGASHPVTGGDSPSNISDEVQTYTPEK